MVALPLSITDARDRIRTSRDQYIFLTICRKYQEGKERKSAEEKSNYHARKCSLWIADSIIRLIWYEILFSQDSASKMIANFFQRFFAYTLLQFPFLFNLVRLYCTPVQSASNHWKWSRKNRDLSDSKLRNIGVVRKIAHSTSGSNSGLKKKRKNYIKSGNNCFQVIAFML